MSATDDLRDLLALPMGPGLTSIMLGTLLDPANLSTILTALADTHGLGVCSGAAVDAGWFEQPTRRGSRVHITREHPYIFDDEVSRVDGSPWPRTDWLDPSEWPSLARRPLYLPASGEA